MLLVPKFANTKYCKNPEKLLKGCHMGTHLRLFSESFPMTGFRLFSMKVASALEGLIWMGRNFLIAISDLQLLFVIRNISFMAWLTSPMSYCKND